MQRKQQVRECWVCVIFQVGECWVCVILFAQFIFTMHGFLVPLVQGVWKGAIAPLHGVKGNAPKHVFKAYFSSFFAVLDTKIFVFKSFQVHGEFSHHF